MSYEPVVELADRQSEDFHVALFWSRRSDRVWVRVRNRHNGRCTRIDATRANALEVFHHPNAYEGVAA